MAQTIQNNSLYLADDFIQALGNAQPAQVSKFQLVSLPMWSETAEVGCLHIDAERLGLPSTTTNPNVLLPAVLEQYWQNLCGHARKQHGQVDKGKVIENFTEPAFWKCLATLLSTQPLDVPTSICVAESTDVITNVNTTDGNASMEVLLAIPAGTLASGFTWKPAKPTYLSVDKLPATSMETTLVGDKTAMYDNDVPYYNIAASQCIASKAQSKMTMLAQYNAVLLYYSDGDVEQVAGIYFPNKFEQVAAGIWQLPTIAVQSNATIGYSINIMFCNGDGIDYVASNANTNLAMQAYANMYAKLSNANLAITALTDRIAAMQLNIDNMLRILNDGVLASMQNDIQNFKSMLATHFGGAISTDKLLQLFIQAKQNAGQLALTMNMSDMSKAVLGSEIVVHGATVGQYKSGDVLELGTSITEILRKMLDSRSGTPYIQPFSSATKNGSNWMLVKPGSTNRISDIVMSVEPGDAGPLVDRRALQFDGNDYTGRQIVFLDESTYTHNDLYIIQHDAGMRLASLQQVYRYADGSAHTYDDGTPIDGAILAGSIVSNFYAVPFEQVAIVFANATITTANIVDRINSGDLKPTFVNSYELSKYNQVSNDVTFIIEMSTTDANDDAYDSYADIGIYDDRASVQVRLDLQQTGALLPARITRIANWSGILNTDNVRPSAVFD